MNNYKVQRTVRRVSIVVVEPWIQPGPDFSNKWSHHLLNCFADPKLSIVTLLCPCYSFGTASTNSNYESRCASCLMFTCLTASTFFCAIHAFPKIFPFFYKFYETIGVYDLKFVKLLKSKLGLNFRLNYILGPRTIMLQPTALKIYTGINYAALNFYVCDQRVHIRHQNRLGGYQIFDFLSVLFCFHCSICQQGNEAVMTGFYKNPHFEEEITRV